MAELSNRQLNRITKQLEQFDRRLASVQGIVNGNRETLAFTRLTNTTIVVMGCWTIMLLAMGYRQAIDLYGAVADTLPILEGPKDKQAQFIPDNTPLKLGDAVAGLTVSSPYLDPTRLDHRGVDIAGPEGTPYYAPGKIKVKCYWDTYGGGNVAEFQFAGLRWQLLHLLDDSCVPGRHQPGSQIGEMGNTGNSTGPHLHLQLRDGGEFVEPKKGHAIAVLSPPSHPTLANVTELVMELEGFRAQPYWDYQQWTVGYGTRAQSQTDTVTESEARRRLEADLARRSQTLERLVQVPLSANQRAALISFIFNVGDGAFERSRLLRKLNAGDYAGAANEFDIWVYVKDGAEKSAGLVKRRQREKLLFLKG